MINRAVSVSCKPITIEQSLSFHHRRHFECHFYYKGRFLINLKSLGGCSPEEEWYSRKKGMYILSLTGTMYYYVTIETVHIFIPYMYGPNRHHRVGTSC